MSSNSQYGDYALLILLHGAQLETESEFQPRNTAHSAKAAFDIVFNLGIPGHIVMRSTQSMRDSDQRSGMRELVASIESSLKTMEQAYKYLPTPMIVSMTDPDNSSDLQAIVKRLQRASSEHQRGPVMARRHDSVMQEFAGAFETFMRTGRWGSCPYCPMTKYAGITTVLPELCEHTERHDHNLAPEELFARYKDRMARPYR